MPSLETTKQISFLKYNNYANRLTHPYDTFYDIMGEYNVLTGMYANEIARITATSLWNPNDGITTDVNTPNGVDFSTEPDYVLVWLNDTSNTIESYWFVTETVRLHSGQYKCYLKRDVFKEAWNELMEATCRIDRAILNKYSVLAFNPEPIEVNRINTQEIEIKDKTGCPWIVFYSSTAPSDLNPVTVSVGGDDLPITYTVNSIDSFKADHTFRFLPDNEHSIQLAINASYLNSDAPVALLPYGLTVDGHTAGRHLELRNRLVVSDNVPINTPLNTFKANESYVEGGITKTLHTLDDAQAALAYDNTVVWDSTADKYYKISVRLSDTTTVVDTDLNGAPATNAYIVLGNDLLDDYTNWDSVFKESSGPIYSSDWIKKYEYRDVICSAMEVELTTVTAQVPAASYEPSDAPYYVWCMPYGNISMTWKDNGTYYQITSDKDLNLRIANAFAKANSTASLFDVQILPFCPLADQFITYSGGINIEDNTRVSDKNTIKDSNNDVKGFIFSCQTASFKRQILLPTPYNAIDYKLGSITRLYRLYSPNYASSFEFSVEKNGGLRGFNIRCTYMPVNPYIRVAPIWGGLYGINEDEVRGLICSGDYSLPRINDAWVQYQENNKNYDGIFNRQIENMDKLHTIQMSQGGAQALVGAAGAGLMAGALTGSAGWGIAGGLTSLAAGAIDQHMEQLKYKENRSYATDIHQLQIGNIQAMPHTLAKTTAFNVDNRYFPIFTVYDCTEEEKQMVIEFINRRSMNVGIIDKPANYVNNLWNYTSRGFIQGTIVRIDSKHDTHFIDELNNEFQKGVFTR